MAILARCWFESHLYGIETIVYYNSSVVIILFESHLYGIETKAKIQQAVERKKV